MHQYSFSRALAAALALAAMALCPAAQARPEAPAKQPRIQWELLAKASASARHGVRTVNYPAPLAQQNGKWVTITGFMVPLEAKFLQSRYLLTPKLSDCESCIEGGPSGYIEVRGTPLHYRPEPLTLSGRLTLLQDDPSGMYYRLTEARLAQ